MSTKGGDQTKPQIGNSWNDDAWSKSMVIYNRLSAKGIYTGTADTDEVKEEVL